MYYSVIVIGHQSLVPQELRNIGLKVSFINSDGKVETWEFGGGTFTNVISWIQSGIQAVNLSNRLSSLITITKYSLFENGWYDYLTGAFADSNMAFQRAEIELPLGAQRLIAKNAKRGAGFAICLMCDDELLYSITSDNVIEEIDMLRYPTCNRLRVSTQRSLASYFFVVVDYSSACYNKKEIDTFIKETDNDIKEISRLVGIEDSAVAITKEWQSGDNLYIDRYINIKEGQTFRVRVDTDVAKIGTGARWSLAVTAIDDSYYYLETNMDFNTDVTLMADKELTRLNMQINKVSFIEATEVTFYSSIPNEGGLICQMSELKKDVEELKGQTPSMPNSPTIKITDTIHCVAGDTIQLYYNMFIQHIGEYSLNIECPKGKNYPRYWEYTPTSNDVGRATMKIQLLNIDGSVIEEKSVNIVTKNAVNPSSPNNILLVGDSLYASGQIAIELSRRLKGTSGVATSPPALLLSNFNLVGRLKNSDKSVGWEGTGGWSWNTYTGKNGMAGARLTVSGVTDVRVTQDSLYRIDGFTQQFYISEMNINDGNGYLFAAFYGKGDIYNNHSKMPESGVLKKQRGEGQEEISFTASKVESYQPFWNNDTDEFDIQGYVDTYCDGHLELLCVQLGINSIIGANPFSTDFETTTLNAAKKFIDLVHAQLPDTRILLATLPLPSQNGGLGANYAAGDASGSYLITSWNYKVHRVNDLYRTLSNDKSYKEFVSVIDICSEMDSDNNYPYSYKQLNTRNSETEKIGNNGVHPANEGYWQIADAWFRAVI